MMQAGPLCGRINSRRQAADDRNTAFSRLPSDFPADGCAIGTAFSAPDDSQNRPGKKIGLSFHIYSIRLILQCRMLELLRKASIIFSILLNHFFLLR
jgi:hypothetical protein